MVEKSLGELIDTRINYLINQQPVNLEGIIVKVYTDSFVDVQTEKGLVSYIKCIGTANNGNTGIIVFIDGDLNKQIFICKSDDGGSGDLSEYVRKTDLIDKTKFDIDLNLNFGLKGEDDNIMIDMDIVDHIVNKTIDIN